MRTGSEQATAGEPAVEELDFAEVSWGGMIGEGGFGKVRFTECELESLEVLEVVGPHHL